MSFVEALATCRRRCELAPFLCNNRNTFASIAKYLVADWIGSLPPVEAQIVHTTLGHYVAGQIAKQELLTVPNSELLHIIFCAKSYPNCTAIGERRGRGGWLKVLLRTPGH
jgi:hypothetical protein